jgi:hypothetical protein
MNNSETTQDRSVLAVNGLVTGLLVADQESTGYIKSHSLVIRARGFQSHHKPDDGDRDSSPNVGFYLQPIDAVLRPRRFYCS